MPTQGDSGGFLLSLVTESFAVRALLGSLAAAGLAAILVGAGFVRTRRARRLTVLAPVLTAAAAAVASVGQVYLPQLWVATGTGASGALLDAFGEHRGLVTERGVDALILTYVLAVTALLSRRVAGAVRVHWTLRSGRAVRPEHQLQREVARLAAGMGVRPPGLLIVPGCPGGSFTTGTRRAVIAVDPEVVGRLDAREREGLLAHELAHVRRRDTALALVVGLFRDIAFFLPPLHLAVRWLRREQEEGADELASAYTGRPVALASSILKVWDCSRERKALAGVCAAVPGGAGTAALPSGVLAAGSSVGETVKTIAVRVERLIARAPAPTRLRQRAEAGLAAAAIVTGTTAALMVPAWIDTRLDGENLTFVYLSAPPVLPVESPALATFRSLTPTADELPAVAAAQPDPAEIGSQPAPAGAGCPCVESRADLARREPAVGQSAPARLSWGSADRPAWDVRSRYGDAPVRTARPLVLLSDTGAQVGVFLVSAGER